MKFWRSIERLPGGAVMLEWQRELEGEFDHARPFLQLSPDLAKTFPCTNPAGCGLPHSVEPDADGESVAICDPEECCPPIPLERPDLFVFALDSPALCRAIATALNLSAPLARNGAGARAELVGLYSAANASVYLMLPGDSARMAREVERLFCAHPDPFVLLTPTGIHCSREVESALKRQLCVHVPLIEALSLNGAGSFAVKKGVRPVLDGFVQRLGEGKGLVKTVERIDRNLDLVARDKFEQRTARAKLEQMRAEGLFGFAKKIDAETLQQFFMIMAMGDIAKASRELGLSDSTLRSKVNGWKKRGKQYAALADFVRWRKSMKGEAGLEEAKAIASGTDRDVDHEGLLRDVLEELAGLNEENFEEKRDELVELLRAQRS